MNALAPKMAADPPDEELPATPNQAGHLQALRVAFDFLAASLAVNANSTEEQLYGALDGLIFSAETAVENTINALPQEQRSSAARAGSTGTAIGGRLGNEVRRAVETFMTSFAANGEHSGPHDRSERPGRRHRGGHHGHRHPHPHVCLSLSLVACRLVLCLAWTSTACLSRYTQQLLPNANSGTGLGSSSSSASCESLHHYLSL